MTEMLIILILAGLLCLALMLGSGAIWLWVILRWRANETVLESRFRSEFAPVPRIALLITWSYLLLSVAQFVRSGPEPILKPHKMIELVEFSIFEGIAVIFAFLLALFTMQQGTTGRYRLGFRGDHRGQQILEGCLGFVAALLPVFIAMLISLPFRSLEQTHPFLRLLHEEGQGVQFLTVAFAAVVIAPFKEELMFRVVLQSWLTKWMGATSAIFCTALIFAAVHGFPDMIGLLPLALILGYLYMKRRSFATVVIVHALFNAFNLGLLFLQKYAEQVPDPTDAFL